jgi:hypothetical protein
MFNFTMTFFTLRCNYIKFIDENNSWSILKTKKNLFLEMTSVYEKLKRLTRIRAIKLSSIEILMLIIAIKSNTVNKKNLQDFE